MSPENGSEEPVVQLCQDVTDSAHIDLSFVFWTALTDESGNFVEFFTDIHGACRSFTSDFQIFNHVNSSGLTNLRLSREDSHGITKQTAGIMMRVFVGFNRLLDGGLCEVTAREITSNGDKRIECRRPKQDSAGESQENPGPFGHSVD